MPDRPGSWLHPGFFGDADDNGSVRHVRKYVCGEVQAARLKGGAQRKIDLNPGRYGQFPQFSNCCDVTCITLTKARMFTPPHVIMSQ